MTLDYAALDSFVVVICVEGKGMIADDSGNEMPLIRARPYCFRLP